MANEQNLKPVRSKKEARERGKMQEKISLSLIQGALNGNVKAFSTIRDTILYKLEKYNGN